MITAYTRFIVKAKKFRVYIILTNWTSTLNIFPKLILDLLFIFLGIISFYGNGILSIIITTITILFFYKKGRYKKSLYNQHLNNFIDFLNVVHSNIGAGDTFDSAVRNTKNNEYALHLAYLIKFSVNDQILIEEMIKLFPLNEVKVFAKHLSSSRRTGASQSKLISSTLDKLTEKLRMTSEAEVIMFQKQIEGQILSLSPILLIMLINKMSENFMTIMYTTSIGKIVMTFAFGLLLIMKYLTEVITKLDIDLNVEIANYSDIVTQNLIVGITITESLKEAEIISLTNLEKQAEEKNDKQLWRFIRLIKQYISTGSYSVIEGISRLGTEVMIEKLASIKKDAEIVAMKLTILLMLGLVSSMVVVITPVILMIKGVV